MEVLVSMTCIELFAGAGGASLGLRRAGFRSLLAVEWDADAAATLASAGASEDAVHGDVRNLELYAGLEGHVDLLWASPPCQAWSTAGKRLGAFDERNGWPWTFDVVDRVQPRWLLCENVVGVKSHRTGCEVVGSSVPDLAGEATVFGLFSGRGQDTLPPPEDCPGCYWERSVLVEASTRYEHVSYRVLNAADYGVPQVRRRLILAAGPTPFPWPEPTHSVEALWHDKLITKRYWEKHGTTDPSNWSVADKRACQLGDPRGIPWVTVRDVLYPPADAGSRFWLKPPQVERTARFRGTMDLAMDPDLPSDTVTCRRGGSQTNDALIIDQGGILRYLLVDEVAKLQAFPPDYPWQGSRSAQYKQVGNAVPPPLAEALGRSVLSAS